MEAATEPEVIAHLTADLTVMGGGLSGLATATNLSKMGFRVICIEAATDFANIVGESLDWSAPELFKQRRLMNFSRFQKLAEDSDIPAPRVTAYR